MECRKLLSVFGFSFAFIVNNSEACQASGCYPKNEIMLKYEREQIDKVQQIKRKLSEIDSTDGLKELLKTVKDTLSSFEDQMRTDSVSAGYIGLPYLFNELYGIQLVLDFIQKYPSAPLQTNPKVLRVVQQNKSIFEKMFPDL